MVGKLQNPKVALVHQMPFTTDQKGLAATVEKVGSILLNLVYGLVLNSCFQCVFNRSLNFTQSKVLANLIYYSFIYIVLG